MPLCHCQREPPNKPNIRATTCPHIDLRPRHWPSMSGETVAALNHVSQYRLVTYKYELP